MKKSERLKELAKLIEDDPFLTDEHLCEKLGVSIQTIRLDRLSLGIPEVRERLKSVASYKVKSLVRSELVGELIDLELGKRGISILEADDTMVFEKTKIVKGHFIFAMAETLAMSVIDANVAITGVANIKYRVPVMLGQKLVAKANLVKTIGSEYYVHVTIEVNSDQVFRGKFRLVAIPVGE
jgi:acyl-coenzyme A thioesterase PaaI-like protein